jgi:hypothetical protein
VKALGAGLALAELIDDLFRAGRVGNVIGEAVVMRKIGDSNNEKACLADKDCQSCMALGSWWKCPREPMLKYEYVYKTLTCFTEFDST